MIKLFWTQPALEDLEDIHHYISKDSVVYANTVVSEILNAVEYLAEYPEHGLVIPEYDGVTREIIVGNYRVIYDYSQPAINILSVIHTARLFPNF